MRTGIALGSNTGDRLANLCAGRDAVLRLAGVTEPVRQSRVYETKPVDCAPGARDFLNAAVEVEYGGDPRALLDALHRIEAQLGRPGIREKNAPRSMDLDLLYCGSLLVAAGGGFELPHPRITARAFVLAPLNDFAPTLVLPGANHSVRELLAAADSAGVRALPEAPGW